MVGKNQVTLTFAGDAASLERASRNSSASLKRFESDVEHTNSRLKTFGADVTSSSNSLASGLAKIGKVAALGLGVAGVAAVAFGTSAVHAFEEAQQVGKQTDAVIKSMGASSWTSAGQVSALAGKLSEVAGIDDELIQSGQNVLLTFGNVRNEIGKGNDIFDRATTSALDMSVALGQDMQSSVTQLGKALNDPIAGISALSRVGIQFTEQQKEQITAMVEAGDTLGAQKVILAEVEKQFKGSAASQATASGKMAVAWGNLQEALGEKLLPIFNAVSSWVMDTGLPALEDLSAWFEREGVPVVKAFGQWVGENVLPALQDFGMFVKNTLVPTLVELGQWFVDHQTVLAAVGIGITAMLVPAFIAWAIAAGTAAIATIAAAAPLILLGAAVAAFAFLVITHWETIRAVTEGVFVAVTGAISGAFNWVKTNWPLLLAILTGPIGLAVLAIVRNFQTIKDTFTAVKDWIGNRIGDIVGFFIRLPGRILDALGDLGSLLKDAGSALIGGLLDGITSKFENVRSTLGDLTSKITSWKGPRSTDLVLLRPAGQAVMSGLMQGIEDRRPELRTQLRGVTSDIQATFNMSRVGPQGRRTWDYAGSPSKGTAVAKIFATGEVIHLGHRKEDEAAQYLKSIGKLHQGGVFPGAPGTEGLALLQAGERVTPANKAGMAPTIVINVAGSLRSDRDLVEVIRNEFQRGGFGGAF